MGPGTIGLAATQINLFVNMVLATGQGTGAVSWLNYAFRLIYLPIGLFGVSIAAATLPAVSRHAARRDENAVRRTVADGLSLMLMLNVPATVGLMVLATPIVRLIFERSAFTPADTAATAAALQFYAIGPRRLFHRAYRLSRVLRARAEPDAGHGQHGHGAGKRAPERGACEGHGLPRGWRSARQSPRSSMRRCSCFFFAGAWTGFEGGRVAGSMVRITVASALMGIAAVAADTTAGAWLPGPGLIPQVIRLTATIGIAIGVLSAAAYVLRIKEFREGVTLVVRKFRTTPR